MKTPPKKRTGSWTLPDECLACGAENSYRRQLTCTDKMLRGETFNVKHHHWVCSACHVGILGDQELDEALRAATAAYQTAHGLLTAPEIQERRKAKHWNQQELATHSGLGIATIKRLELGTVIQTKVNDSALRQALRRDDSTVAFVHQFQIQFVIGTASVPPWSQTRHRVLGDTGYACFSVPSSRDSHPCTDPLPC